MNCCTYRLYIFKAVLDELASDRLSPPCPSRTMQFFYTRGDRQSAMCADGFGSRASRNVVLAVHPESFDGLPVLGGSTELRVTFSLSPLCFSLVNVSALVGLEKMVELSSSQPRKWQHAPHLRARARGSNREHIHSRPLGTGKKLLALSLQQHRP